MRGVAIANVNEPSRSRTLCNDRVPFCDSSIFQGVLNSVMEISRASATIRAVRAMMTAEGSRRMLSRILGERSTEKHEHLLTR